MTVNVVLHADFRSREYAAPVVRFGDIENCSSIPVRIDLWVRPRDRDGQFLRGRILSEALRPHERRPLTGGIHTVSVAHEAVSVEVYACPPDRSPNYPGSVLVSKLALAG